MNNNKYLIEVLGINDMGKAIALGRWRSNTREIDTEVAIKFAAEAHRMTADNFKELFNPSVIIHDVTVWDDVLPFPGVA